MGVKVGVHEGPIWPTDYKICYLVVRNCAMREFTALKMKHLCVCVLIFNCESNTHLSMRGKDILCAISKGVFEIPHKISCPYFKRFDFYIMLKFEGS